MTAYKPVCRERMMESLWGVLLGLLAALRQLLWLLKGILSHKILWLLKGIVIGH